MIKIETYYTETEARQIVSGRGLNIEERNVIGYDGETAFTYKQWQVWNPFLMRWEPLETVFRQAIQQANYESHRARLSIMSLEKFFK